MRLRCMLLGMIVLAGAVEAADLYRWVDENGRTHVADVVPPRYQDVATKVDTTPSAIPESQRQEALDRAAREKQLVEERMHAAPPPPPPAASMPPPSRAGELRPSDISDAECAEQIRAYRESQECFAQFTVSRRDGRHHRRAFVRPEAYDHCKRVPSPYSKCGPPSYSPSEGYPY